MKKNEQEYIKNPIVDELYGYLSEDTKKSFFLFAGAGSGKTETLIRLLDKLKSKYREEYLANGQQIAVITYTNAAVAEINSRLNSDVLFSISTIHSFVWGIISPHQNDIRVWLTTNLRNEIIELENEQRKGKAGTKTAATRTAKIESRKERLANIKLIKRFSYDPNGENIDKESLNHNEVIELGANFITNKPQMRNIVARKHPILLIDESQDTNKQLMESFFVIQAEKPHEFCLGLFGDTMQRIYNDGKQDIQDCIPSDWMKPAIKSNHRSPRRIVELINNIRSSDDGRRQAHSKNEPYGTVCLFLCQKDVNKDDIEHKIGDKMAEITSDVEWSHTKANYWRLTLEHHMAAKRLGFDDFYNPLREVDSLGSGLLKGSLPGIVFFTKTIIPLTNAALDKFKIASIVRSHSPLLKISHNEPDKLAIIQKANKAVDELLALFHENNDPLCIDVLKSVVNSRLFDIPDILKIVAARSLLKPDAPEDINNESSDNIELKKIEAYEAAFSAPFSMLKSYISYISDETPFRTHQGVKGLEFPRVMVIIDDDEARGFLFSYDKLFGVKGESQTDNRNRELGKETGIERTRRLFYVTCSRAEESLAVVYYTGDPDKVMKNVINEGWFNKEEITILTQN